MSSGKSNPAPMQGFVWLGDGAEDRADERPDVDGAIKKITALTDQIEAWQEEIDMDGYVPTKADLETLHGIALGAWGCLARYWDGEGWTH